MRRIIDFVRCGDRLGLVRALQAGGDIEYVDVDGQGLLHAAAVNNIPVEIAEELLARQIDVDRRDSSGQTALIYAATWKRSDVAERILRAGGSQHIADNHGNQPLWYAVLAPDPDLELVRLLCRYGADVTHKNRYGKSPIDFATKVGRENVVRALQSD